ncbi:tail fiber domain-containing protein [Dyadobacter fanqingshengii]|uniref:Tail fiber domain-containing protein n=1 Tax=Dyadobacter fanqingshengii TaxID=2906443 RepID=A0A9X1PAV3_9BACT|nr:tail fiber domain-containing protein [Dyadobacter fanqingshengii]MCF0040844.1 tail fiber domain-containing protein [Dyadobacter fanqingshengii]USJ37423.1 tail fiber domain-containing protein [Dyadobacter fanqingshengii]
MKKILTLLLCALSGYGHAQIGIGTLEPKAGLHIDEVSVLFSASENILNPRDIPISGTGRRMLWYIDKAAFRVGFVGGIGSTYWDMSNVGHYSFAAGLNSLASGKAGIAMGNSVIATGDAAVAIGFENRAGAASSLALGKNARANHPGACVIGDASASSVADSVYSSDSHQMNMRFTGGYRLFTSQNMTTGVLLAPGAGSWSNVSDKRKKENFGIVDSELILQKLAQLPVTYWNYKTQAATKRHIGPMAQDFYSAFQLDGIGNDTTINSVDIDGVNMAAIQALEKRTKELQLENDQLKARMAALEKQTAVLTKAVMGEMTENKVSASR